MISDDVAFRLDPAALHETARKMRSRGGVLVVLGVPLLLLGIVFAALVVIGVATHHFEDKQRGERFVALLLAAISFGPLVVAILLVLVGARRMGRADRLRDLSALTQGSGRVTVLGLVARTGRPPSDIFLLLGLGQANGAVWKDGATTVPNAPVDVGELARVTQKLWTRGLVGAIAAVPLAIFTLVAGTLIVVGFSAAEGIAAYLVGVFVFAGGALLPAYATWRLGRRARRAFRDRSRFNGLAAAHAAGARTFEDLGRIMNLPPDEVLATIERAREEHGLFVPKPFAVAPAGATNAPSSPPPQSPSSWVGRTIRGSYYVEAPLGHGGMGVVYRAKNLATGASCALKVLVLSRYESDDVLRRFEREATLSRGLAHPGLVRVDDFGRAEDGTPFLVMELLEGETLEERLARLGSLPFFDALRIGVALGDALAAAHRAGFLHRDVKPANVMLARTPNGERAVLIDFGLAKRLDAASRSRVTTTGAVLGTPLYMSPEQARGEPLDERSDLYGLAVVVYEMLAGFPPFFDATLAEAYARLLREPPPLLGAQAPGRSSPALDAVLARAMSTRREDRFRDVGELVAALRSFGV